MGFPQEEVKKALESQKYNEVTGVYLLLGRKAGEVCVLAAKHVGPSKVSHLMRNHLCRGSFPV